MDVSGNMVVENSGYVSSVAYDQNGAGGGVTVPAGNLLVDGGADGAQHTYISADAWDGDAWTSSHQRPRRGDRRERRPHQQ